MSDNLVQLAVYNSVQEAYIIKGMLEDHDIPCAISDENNIYVPVFQGVRVLVRESDFAKAEALLKEFND